MTTDHLRGEFSVIDVGNPKALPRKIGPLKGAMVEMIGELIKLPCPDFPDATPLPQDFKAIAEHVRAVSLIAGRWLRKVGLDVSANALCRIEAARFADDTFLEAVDGWATDEIMSAARATEDDLEDRGMGDAGDRAWDERRV